jgi:predicted transcriptional regulator
MNAIIIKDDSPIAVAIGVKSVVIRLEDEANAHTSRLANRTSRHRKIAKLKICHRVAVGLVKRENSSVFPLAAIKHGSDLILAASTDECARSKKLGGTIKSSRSQRTIGGETLALNGHGHHLNS